MYSLSCINVNGWKCVSNCVICFSNELNICYLLLCIKMFGSYTGHKIIRVHYVLRLVTAEVTFQLCSAFSELVIYINCFTVKKWSFIEYFRILGKSLIISVCNIIFLSCFIFHFGIDFLKTLRESQEGYSAYSSFPVNLLHFKFSSYCVLWYIN